MNVSIVKNEKNYGSEPIRLQLDPFRSINHILLTSLGLPLNLLIVIVILTNQRIKRKARNIIFLGASLSAVFTLLTILIELLTYHCQSIFLCKIFGLSTKVAYSCLLFNLTLALLDRYLAIVNPFLHRKVVTVKNVVIIQAIGAVVIFFLFKWPYVFGVVPLQCDFVLIEGKIVAVTNAILIFLIVILNIVVYVKTKYYAHPGRDVSVSFVNNHQPSNITDNIEDNTEPQQVSIQFAPTNTSDVLGSNIKGNGNRSDSFSLTSLATRICSNAGNDLIPTHPNTSTPIKIHGGNRQMELEATFTLLIGVSSLLTFTAPMLIISSIEMGCLWIMGSDADKGEEQHCSRVFTVSLPYCREFLLYHLVYNPIMYMIRSKEFSSTLTEKWTRTNRRRQSRSGSWNRRMATATTMLPQLPQNVS